MKPFLTNLDAYRNVAPGKILSSVLDDSGSNTVCHGALHSEFAIGLRFWCPMLTFNGPPRTCSLRRFCSTLLLASFAFPRTNCRLHPNALPRSCYLARRVLSEKDCNGGQQRLQFSQWFPLQPGSVVCAITWCDTARSAASLTLDLQSSLAVCGAFPVTLRFLARSCILLNKASTRDGVLIMFLAILCKIACY